MRSFLMGMILMAATVGFGQGSSRFTSSPDYFSASFLGEVEQSKRVTTWDMGQLTSTIYSSQVGLGLFRVMVTPLPREVFRIRSAQEMLDSARDGTLTMSRMTIEGEQKLLISGAPGRRFIVDTPDSPTVVHLVVVANGRLYQASATLPRSELGKGVEFVRSFALNAVVNVGG